VDPEPTIFLLKVVVEGVKVPVTQEDYESRGETWPYGPENDEVYELKLTDVDND
jgi:hypothetical protein